MQVLSLFSKFIIISIICAIFMLGSSTVSAQDAMAATQVVEPTAWWFYPLILLVLSFALGVFAVLAGVGGGVLYVPIVSGFLPFHLDFVRGAGRRVCHRLASPSNANHVTST